jgi:hypothetical protein
MIAEDLNPKKLYPIRNKMPEQATDRYELMQHGDFLDCMRQAVIDGGCRVGGVRCSVSAGSAPQALIAVEVLRHNVDLPPTVGLWFGGLNSNDRRRASRMFGGVMHHKRGFVFTKYEGMSRLRSNSIKLGVEASFDDLLTDAETFPGVIEELRETPITGDDRNNLMIRAAAKGMLKPKELEPLISDRIETTMWRAMCAFHDATAKRVPISTHPKTDRLLSLHNFFRLVTETIQV